MEKVLKSAWQLAKEMSQERNLDVNSIKVEIIRAGKKGAIKTFTYKNGDKSVNLYEEEEVRAAFDLGEKLSPYSVEATSKEMKDGYWIPELQVAEHKGDRVQVMLWQWREQRFPNKKKADQYAKAAGIEKLKKMVN